MNIIIPLGGKGERFKKQGYDNPKPLIKVFNKEILFYVIDNLNIQENDKIFIIYNNYLDDYNFKEIMETKYPDICLIKLEHNTKGAAETVNIGLEYIINNQINTHKYNEKTILLDGDIYYTTDILNKFREINTNAVFFTKNYEKNPVFSYIDLDENNKITKIAEKIKISDNSNTGAYAFDNIHTLLKYSKYVLDNNITFNNECYTSCIIDCMINNNENFVGIELNPEYVFVLGTPKQVNEYINNTHAFLFDLDGTLIISDEIYFDIWTYILKDYNIYLNKDIFNKIIQGNSDESVLKKLLPNKDVNLKEISEIKDKLFYENISKIKIIDGAINFIKFIKKRGHKIAIVTNCNRNTAKKILEIIDINKYIDELIIGGECEKPKPYPDPYLKACKIFNIDPSKSFVFEDSKSGLLSGRNINPKCLIGITTIYNENELINLGVNIVINNFNEINYEKLITYNHNFNEKIEKYIRNSLKEDIKDIKIYNEKIKGGYISDIIRVSITKNDNTNNYTEMDCILKLENKNDTMLSKMAIKLGLYEREYYFYENISKYVNIEIPKFYTLIKDENLNNFGILMENLNDPNTKLNLNLNIENINVSLKIIDSCAKLHSKFWNKDLNNIFPELPKNSNIRFNPTWNNYISENYDLFKSKWSYLLTTQQLNISDKIVKNFQKIQNNLSDKNLTLCHGDVKSLNLFYKNVSNDKELPSYIPYFIDWQYISNGKGVQDIVFLMIESYDIEKIKLYIPLLKNYYYVKLLEYGITNYSYNDYEKDFINAICYYPFFVGIWFGITPEEDLIDKNFPFFYIQKLFNFIINTVPENFYD